MEFVAKFKQLFLNFIFIHFGISLAMGIAGSLFDSNNRFGYEGFFAPLIYAAICVIPTAFINSEKVLTVRQVLVQKIVHVLMIEGIMYCLYFWQVEKPEIGSSVSIGVSVVVVFLLVHLIQWGYDTREANRMTAKLKTYKSSLH